MRLGRENTTMRRPPKKKEMSTERRPLTKETSEKAVVHPDASTSKPAGEIAAESPKVCAFATDAAKVGTEKDKENEVFKARQRQSVSLRWVYEQGASLLVKSYNEERMKENLNLCTVKFLGDPPSYSLSIQVYIYMS